MGHVSNSFITPRLGCPTLKSARCEPTSWRRFASAGRPGAGQYMDEEEALGSSQPREAQASPLLRLSTRALPERDRFEVFRETFSQYVYRGDITNRAEGTFEGGIDLLKAGSVAISRIAALPSVYARSRRHASDSDEALTLFVGLTHGVTIQQAGVLHEFRPGNGFLYHGSIPGGGEAVSPFEVWGIKVPASRIRSGLVPGRNLKPMQIPSELPAMRLIVQYLNSFPTVAASLDPDVHEAFGTHLVDLLMLIVGAGRNSLELIKGRGLKAARTAAVLKTIERGFASPGPLGRENWAFAWHNGASSSPVARRDHQDVL